MNSKADFFFDKPSKWQAEYRKLRSIILNCKLDEELKWGKPGYTYQKKNVVLIHGFKDYCALLFFKGALLKDSKNILIQQTENVQSARQIRFTDVSQITKLQKALKDYIQEAIEVEKAGLNVPLKKTASFKIPDEFQHALKKSAALKKAFDALTPGRQRAYLLYFSQPKQSKTRESRIENYKHQILDGKGLND